MMERFGGQGREVESELTLEERVKWLETRIVTLKKELVDGDVASLKHVMRLEREIISDYAHALSIIDELKGKEFIR